MLTAKKATSNIAKVEVGSGRKTFKIETLYIWKQAIIALVQVYEILDTG